MSVKIKSKDLSYDASLPPFLQRLRAQNTGSGGDPDRHERPTARPRKAKNPDDDDGPTVVDESGETVSKDEYAKLTRAEPGGGDDASNTVNADLVAIEVENSGALPPTPAEAQERGNKAEARLTDAVVTKKRKIGKVVGGAEPDEEAEKSTSSTAKVPKKAKKKARPVKLAFDEDEQG